MEPQTSTLFLLSNLSSVLDTLIETAKQKQDAIVKGDCQALEQIIRKEEQVLSEIEITQHKLCAEPLPTHGDSENGEEYFRLKQDVARKVRQLKALNEQNQKLLSKSLEIVRYELGLLLPQDDYSKVSKNPPIAFDQKA